MLGTKKRLDTDYYYFCIQNFYITYEYCVNYNFLGPKWFPIIGNTLMLRKEVKKYGSQAGAFLAWKDKYNSPVIGLKLGKELFVVALTYPIINEVHTNSVFDGRPDNFFQRLRNMGRRFGKQLCLLFCLEFYACKILISNALQVFFNF